VKKTFAVALMVGVAVLAAAPAAQAHNYLVASSPVAGETLTALPDAFFVTTNEDLLTLDGTAGFAFQIVDAAGLHYESGCVEVDGATMSTVPRLGEPGEYTALWQVVSADGHTVSDEIDFTWAPAGDVDVSPGAAGAPGCGDDGAAPPPAQPSAPQPAPASPIRLEDVLWIGGAVVAVGVAVAITIAVLARRRPNA
jgi:copper resistance protein C